MKKLKTILMGLRTNLGATKVFVDDKREMGRKSN